MWGQYILPSGFCVMKLPFMNHQNWLFTRNWENKRLVICREYKALSFCPVESLYKDFYKTSQLFCYRT